MKWIARIGLCPLLALALWIACAPSAPPVAVLVVSPTELEISYPGYQELSLEWTLKRPLEGLEGSPRVFLHLLDREGRVARTFDHPFPVEWREGRGHTYLQKVYQSALAPPLESGTYHLTAGLYDRAGNRWPLEGRGGALDTAEYDVASVEVRDTGEGIPMFYFSPDWLPVEGGTDRQILGRRWLSRNGGLRLGEIQRPGTLWMQVGIPSAGGELQELVLAEGADQPMAQFLSSCGEVGVTIAGSGSHEVEIPVAADEENVAPAECEISIETNFALVSRDSSGERTIALEILAWRGE